MMPSPKSTTGKFYRLLSIYTVILLTACWPGVPAAHAIFGGFNATSLRGQVQLWKTQGSTAAYVCTGSLIASNWVLTAKHCQTQGGFDSLYGVVVTGNLEFGVNNGSGNAHQVLTTILNPNNDTMLVKLASPVTDPSLIVPYGVKTIRPGFPAELRGWGYSSLPGANIPTYSPYLQETSLTATGPSSYLPPSLAPPGLDQQVFVTSFASLSAMMQGINFAGISNGDSGSGVDFSNSGLICAVVSDSDVTGRYVLTTTTDAIAAWIQTYTGVAPQPYDPVTQIGSCDPRVPSGKRVVLKVQATGNLISNGIGIDNTYRSELNADFGNAGLSDQFIGTLTSGSPPADHTEEHGIYHVEDFVYNTQPELCNNNPNVVTLLIGSGFDFNDTPDPNALASKVNSLIGTIFEYSPQVTVLVGARPPSTNSAYELFIEKFNPALRSQVLARKGVGQHVDFVDPGWTSGDLLTASVDLPSPAGWSKLADAFDASAEVALNNGWIVASPDRSPCGSSGSSGSGGSGSGGGSGGQIVTRAVHSTTFTVNAGGTSFTATQPVDSVATYTWTDGGSPTEWLTSADGNGLYNQLATGAVAYGSSAAASATITVNTGKVYQTIDGFGGAMTDSAASLILNSPNYYSILNTLFGQSGAQLSIVRSPMGSSDLMADPNDFHTYEDTQGNFSATAYPSDQRQISVLKYLPNLVGSNLKIIGTPWSAPGWLKRGGSLKPQQCGTDQDELNVNNVQQYAAYFAKYVSAYASLGLPVWMVSMGNEPENCKTAMPTTLLSSSDEISLSKALRAQLPSGVKILGWDHNWNDEDYVKAVTSQGTVDAIGYHCYDGTHYSNQTQVLPTFMTECSGFTNQSGNVAGNLGWEVANNLMGPLRYGGHGSLYWSLAMDPNGNPHLGGSDACQNCRGMITVNADGSFQPSQDYYFWAQFSKFVPPGSVRVDSNNTGDLSTVAFHNGNTTTLVVLNSTIHADGGSAGSDERNLQGHIVQWDGDTAAQKAAWLVGADGYRRWISDGSTYNCLKYDAGIQGPDVEPSGALDKYINKLNVWAVCGAVTMGTGSELELNTYLKSAGGARLTLTNTQLASVDSAGNPRWYFNAIGNRLILQEDQNLVLYAGSQPTWASNTKGSGAIWLSIRDDGTFALFDKNNKQVWVSPINAASYRGKMVEWDGDTAAQKTTWMVGADGNRRWVPDLATFQCLQNTAGNSLSVSSDVLNALPNLNNVWATCGGSQMGINGALELGGYMKAGTYALKLYSNDLIVSQNGGVPLWHTGHGGAELKLQTDGNLVIYDSNGNPTWATGTNTLQPGGNTWLILDSSGHLNLYSQSSNGKTLSDTIE